MQEQFNQGNETCPLGMLLRKRQGKALLPYSIVERCICTTQVLQAFAVTILLITVNLHATVTLFEHHTRSKLHASK
jgi:hypothetical protein